MTSTDRNTVPAIYSQTAKQENLRYSSIDAIRALAIFAVVAIHCDPFTGSPLSLLRASIGDIIDLLCRFAVPFFLITSGYMLGRKIKLGAKQQSVIRPFYVRLGSLIVFWYIFYLVWPIDWHLALQNGLIRSTYWNTIVLFKDVENILNGPRIHLWFLSALLFGGLHVLVVSLYSSERVVFRYFLALYFLGLILGPYRDLFGASITSITGLGRWLLPPLLIALGWLSATHSLKIRASLAFTLFAAGTSLTLVEALLLHETYGVPLSNHDFLLGTPIQAFGLVQLAINKPTWGERTALPMLGRFSLGVYAAHVAIIDVFDARIGGTLPWEILKTFLVYGISLAVVILISKVKPLQKFLT